MHCACVVSSDSDSEGELQVLVPIANPAPAAGSDQATINNYIVNKAYNAAVRAAPVHSIVQQTRAAKYADRRLRITEKEGVTDQWRVGRLEQLEAEVTRSAKEKYRAKKRAESSENAIQRRRAYAKRSVASRKKAGKRTRRSPHIKAKDHDSDDEANLVRSYSGTR